MGRRVVLLGRGSVRGRAPWEEARNRLLLQTDRPQPLPLPQELRQSQVCEHQGIACARGGLRGLASVEDKNNV